MEVGEAMRKVFETCFFALKVVLSNYVLVGAKPSVLYTKTSCLNVFTANKRGRGGRTDHSGE